MSVLFGCTWLLFVVRSVPHDASVSTGVHVIRVSDRAVATPARPCCCTLPLQPRRSVRRAQRSFHWVHKKEKKTGENSGLSHQSHQTTTNSASQQHATADQSTPQPARVHPPSTSSVVVAHRFRLIAGAPSPPPLQPLLQPPPPPPCSTSRCSRTSMRSAEGHTAMQGGRRTARWEGCIGALGARSAWGAAAGRVAV